MTDFLSDFLSFPSEMSSALRWEHHVHERHHLFPGAPRRVSKLPGLHVDGASASGLRHLHQLLRHQHGAHLRLHHGVVSGSRRPPAPLGTPLTRSVLTAHSHGATRYTHTPHLASSTRLRYCRPRHRRDICDLARSWQLR